MRVGNEAEDLEHLPSELEALSANSSYCKVTIIRK
jgi:hypothetical protein